MSRERATTGTTHHTPKGYQCPLASAVHKKPSQRRREQQRGSPAGTPHSMLKVASSEIAARNFKKKQELIGTSSDVILSFCTCQTKTHGQNEKCDRERETSEGEPQNRPGAKQTLLWKAEGWETGMLDVQEVQKTVPSRRLQSIHSILLGVDFAGIRFILSTCGYTA